MFGIFIMTTELQVEASYTLHILVAVTVRHSRDLLIFSEIRSQQYGSKTVTVC